MKTILILMLLMAAQPAVIVVARESNVPSLRLTVDLTDGSRVIGTTTLTSLPARSEALGKLQLPMASIRTINVQGHGNDAPFDITQDIAPGDTVDFIVGCGNGNQGWDTTGLNAVITFVTEAKGTHL